MIVTNVHARDASVEVDVLVPINILYQAVSRRFNDKRIKPRIRGGYEALIPFQQLSGFRSRRGNNNTRKSTHCSRQLRIATTQHAILTFIQTCLITKPLKAESARDLLEQRSGRLFVWLFGVPHRRELTTRVFELAQSL